MHLDLIFARGELSYEMNAMRPEIKKDGSVYLRHARHPLLDPAKAVPIDIELGRSFDTLVITGPNTGGKTVSLKTLGLLCLMTQCGLHIPCDDRSAVSIFFLGVGRHRRRAEHRAEFVDLLGAYEKHRADLRRGRRPQPDPL